MIGFGRSILGRAARRAIAFTSLRSQTFSVLITTGGMLRYSRSAWPSASWRISCGASTGTRRSDIDADRCPFEPVVVPRTRSSRSPQTFDRSSRSRAWPRPPKTSLAFELFQMRLAASLAPALIELAR